MRPRSGRSRPGRPTAAEAKAPAADDPVTQLKRRAQEALLVRMGPALWDPSTPASQLDAQVVPRARRRCSRRRRSRSTTPSAISSSPRSSTQVLGYGPIERFLDDPTVSEVMVNGLDGVYVERDGKLVDTDAQFFSEQHVLRVIDRIVAPLGRRIDESSPMVDARLADGSRVNAVIPPLAIDGPELTIRKFAQRVLTLDDLVRLGTLTDQVGGFLARVRRGPDEHPHQRRHRQRQDHAAQRAVVDDPRRRAHRHDRGRRRAAARSSGTSSGSRAGRRTSRARARSATRDLRAQRAAHAARPHHRRRGPRRRGARHAPGDEHRPRRLAVDAARQLAARRARPGRDHGAHGRHRPADARHPRADRVGRSTCSSTSAAVRDGVRRVTRVCVGRRDGGRDHHPRPTSSRSTPRAAPGRRGSPVRCSRPASARSSTSGCTTLGITLPARHCSSSTGRAPESAARRHLDRRPRSTATRCAGGSRRGTLAARGRLRCFGGTGVFL